MDAENCQHEAFETHSRVGRLTDEHGNVTSFVFECKVKCTQCNQFFEFIGMPCGTSKKYPMTNIDFTELRAPIRAHSGEIATIMSYQFGEDEKTKPENIN